MRPEEVLDEVKKSGLRGRGGGGFRRASSGRVPQRPELRPLRPLQRGRRRSGPSWTGPCSRKSAQRPRGYDLGAYAIGSSEGYIYVRNEYPLAVRNVRIALEQMKELGLVASTSSEAR